MTNKSNSVKKKKFPIISVYFLGFIIAIFFEFYWINYYPYDYFMLIGIGIILCILGYLTIEALVDMINQNAERREAQNEVMIKASKAIYVTAKKIIAETELIGTGSSANAKNIQTLISDLTLANERLAREIESAVSLQALIEGDNISEASSESESISETSTDSEKNAEPVSEEIRTEDTFTKESVPEEQTEDTFTEESAPEEQDVTDNQKQKLTEEQIAKMFADL